ncbi:MAG: hypothetical protein ABJD07_00430 [Gemmatimonadaceae bacterium]
MIADPQHELRHELRRELRRSRRINAVTLSLLVLISAGAFVQATARGTKFDEIDVGRINVREPDGTLRMTISNKARFPDNIIDGKTYPLRSGAREAGLLFFNDRGDEQGGIGWSGRKTSDGHEASGGLAFDQWRQDETVTLSYEDENGRKWAGLKITDRSDVPLSQLADALMDIRGRFPAGAARDSATRALRQDAVTRGWSSASRVLVGRERDKSAVLRLNDRSGRTRMLMSVDSLGIARLQFLDAAGTVTREIAGDAVARPPSR